MIQKLDCPIHLDNPIVFLNTQAYSDSVLTCVLCVSEKKRQFNLLPIQKIQQIDENSLFDSWPPFQENKYDNINDIRNEIKTLIEQNEYQQTEKIKSWFYQLSKQVNQHISERKNFILKQAEKASQLRENIIKKFFEYSQNLHIKKLLEQNLPIDQIEKSLQDFMKSVYEKSESQTQMFQNLIKFNQFINIEDEKSLISNQENIIKFIKSINFFNVNIEDINLSESNIENLFGDQSNFDKLRESISKQKNPVNDQQIDELNIFMENSQNQLSTINSFVASDTCQKEEILKTEYNKLKQFDINLDNFSEKYYKIKSDQLFCYFRKALNPKKKYTFRIRSKSFLSDSANINVGLIKSIKKYIPEVEIEIFNGYNSINTYVEILEFRICIEENLFQVLSYPNYNVIYKSQILSKQNDIEIIANQKAEKNPNQSISNVGLFSNLGLQKTDFQPQSQQNQNICSSNYGSNSQTINNVDWKSQQLANHNFQNLNQNNQISNQNNFRLQTPITNSNIFEKNNNFQSLNNIDQTSQQFTNINPQTQKQNNSIFNDSNSRIETSTTNTSLFQKNNNYQSINNIDQKNDQLTNLNFQSQTQNHPNFNDINSRVGTSTTAKGNIFQSSSNYQNVNTVDQKSQLLTNFNTENQKQNNSVFNNSNSRLETSTTNISIFGKINNQQGVSQYDQKSQQPININSQIQNQTTPIFNNSNYKQEISTSSNLNILQNNNNYQNVNSLNQKNQQITTFNIENQKQNNSIFNNNKGTETLIPGSLFDNIQNNNLESQTQQKQNFLFQSFGNNCQSIINTDQKNQIEQISNVRNSSQQAQSNVQTLFQNRKVMNSHIQQNQEKTQGQGILQVTSSQKNTGLFQEKLISDNTQQYNYQAPQSQNIVQPNLKQTSSSLFGNIITNEKKPQSFDVFQSSSNNDNKIIIKEKLSENSMQTPIQTYATTKPLDNHSLFAQNFSNNNNNNNQINFIDQNKIQQNFTTQLGKQEQQNQKNIFSAQNTPTINQQKQQNIQLIESVNSQNKKSYQEYYFAIQFQYYECEGDEAFKVTYFNESDKFQD
ncbi:hypothetical protein ABPG74_013162 [Tetrahymena malaccensis]